MTLIVSLNPSMKLAEWRTKIQKQFLVSIFLVSILYFKVLLVFGSPFHNYINTDWYKDLNNAVIYCKQMR